jgi:hypothetical protein
MNYHTPSLLGVFIKDFLAMWDMGLNNFVFVHKPPKLTTKKTNLSIGFLGGLGFCQEQIKGDQPSPN